MATPGRPRLYANTNCAKCDRPAISRGLCGSHYHASRIVGKLPPKPKTDPVIRFLKHLLHNIHNRCTNPKASKYECYGGKGIGNELTLDDLLLLWKRDNAHLLSEPSIDRRDSSKNYTLENCRFIEFDENRRNKKPKSVCVKCGNVDRFHFSRMCSQCRQSSWCMTCKKPFTKSLKKICPDCRYITRPCTYCGASVTKDTVANSGDIKNKHWFCSKSEFGKWIGSNFGFAAQYRARQAA